MKDIIKSFFNPHLSACNNKKGFTLIELAIVMVIIGLILGAVMKGQDLINNARVKKVVNWERQWETALWSYMDRRGRLPGDNDKNGIIGDIATPVSGVTKVGSAKFVNPPGTTMQIGSLTFYAKLGYDTVSSVNKNVLVICPKSDCATAITKDELLYFESIDTTLDGSSDAGDGNVRGFATGGAGLSASCSVTDECVAGPTELTTANTDWALTHYGLIYYFDSPYA